MRRPTRVLLVSPSHADYYRQVRVRSAITVSPPLNLAALAGSLLRAGHHVKVVDLNSEPRGERELAQTISSFAPDMVGFSFRTPGYGEASRLADRVRALAPQALIVAGGVHSSVRPEEVVGGPFDIAVINEGDATITELADGLPPSMVKGIAYSGEGKLARTGDRRYLEDPDSLAMPAWHLFDLARFKRRSIVAPNPPVADLESSRGCPGRCIYCTRSVFGSRFRAKSPPRVAREIQDALEAGFNSFNLVDDAFTTDIQRAIEVCEEIIRRGIVVPWTLTNGIRVSHASSDFFRIAARAGLSMVAFGLESGSQELLDAIGKDTTLAQARRAVAAARANSITTLGYFMVGLPGETRETLEATLEFARALDLDYAKFSITVPLPGTELFERWQDLVNPDRYHAINIHRPNPEAFSHPELSWQVIELFLKRAYRRFYLRPEYLAKRFFRALTQGELLFSLETAVGIRW